MKNKSPDNERYGWDSLSVLISAISVIVWAFIPYGFLIGIPLMVFAFWRSRSKEIFERKKEEKVFLNFVRKLRKVLSRFNNNVLFYEIRRCFDEWVDKQRSRRAYSIIICPRCKTKIRLKKQKGESIIWCPKCSTRLRRKTTSKVRGIRKDLY